MCINTFLYKFIILQFVTKYALFSLMYYISSRTELHPILAFLLIFIQGFNLFLFLFLFFFFGKIKAFNKY